MFGDTEVTLSPSCHERIEAEANFGAGRLLFFQDQLRSFISISTPNFALVQAIKKRYGNTLTLSLWRLIEALDVPALGMVGPPPWETSASGAASCRYFIRSATLIEQFANVTENHACSLLRTCSRQRRGGPIADDDVVLVDDCRQEHRTHLESFFNNYLALIFTAAGCRAASEPGKRPGQRRSDLPVSSAMSGVLELHHVPLVLDS